MLARFITAFNEKARSQIFWKSHKTRTNTTCPTTNLTFDTSVRIQIFIKSRYVWNVNHLILNTRRAGKEKPLYFSSTFPTPGNSVSVAQRQSHRIKSGVRRITKRMYINNIDHSRTPGRNRGQFCGNALGQHPAGEIRGLETHFVYPTIHTLLPTHNAPGVLFAGPAGFPQPWMDITQWHFPWRLIGSQQPTWPLWNEWLFQRKLSRFGFWAQRRLSRLGSGSAGGFACILTSWRLSKWQWAPFHPSMGSSNAPPLTPFLLSFDFTGFLPSWLNPSILPAFHPICLSVLSICPALPSLAIPRLPAEWQIMSCDRVPLWCLKGVTTTFTPVCSLQDHVEGLESSIFTSATIGTI